MILLRLFFEFFKVGLFSVGGGLATIPFLENVGTTTGWFTTQQLATMVAVSESTPGPVGVNMATYVGFQTAGIPGAAIATLGLITPSVIVIIIIAGFLQKFRASRTVNDVFYGLRPASTALVAAAGLRVAATVFVTVGGVAEHTFSVSWVCLVMALAVFFIRRLKKLKNVHPIVFIGIGALLGVVFKL